MANQAELLEVSGCKCNEDKQRYLWFDDNEWIFDTDDGMRGPVIEYCPFCGVKLLTA